MCVETKGYQTTTLELDPICVQPATVTFLGHTGCGRRGLLGPFAALCWATGKATGHLGRHRPLREDPGPNPASKHESTTYVQRMPL